MERSPYTPGAGHMPPVLAGRQDQLRGWALMLNDVAAVGRSQAVDLVLTGPRGIGKTAACHALAGLAAERGFQVLSLQAVSGSDLMTSLREEATDRAAGSVSGWRRLRDALDRIAGVSVNAPGGAGIGVTLHPAKPPAVASGASAVARALAQMAQDIRSANDGQGGLMLSVDELQVAPPHDLTFLAAVLHRLNVDQPDARLVFAGTGLPTTQQIMTNAGVTHPDRLFRFDRLPATLDPAEAARAVVEPAQRLGVTWHPAAVQQLLATTIGYPAHLQLFADRTWRAAARPIITAEDFARAAPTVAEQIAEQTLGPRWERLPDGQRQYLAALAILGGHAPSRAVAEVIGVTLSQVSPVRDELIKKGDIYAPRYGVVALSMPMMGPYVLASYDQARRDTPRPDAIKSLDQLRHAAEKRHPAQIRPPDEVR